MRACCRAHSPLLRRCFSSRSQQTDAAASLSCLQNRAWLAERPDTPIRRVCLDSGSSFLLLQDDLLHPVLGGNKLRKLDALLPFLSEQGYTDVLTCGGLQSAHCAAVATACAERGLAAHLLVRGERPAVPAGYHLLARMHGHVSYISRAEYSDRAAMLARHAALLQQRVPAAKVCFLAVKPPPMLGFFGRQQIHVLAEGAAEPLALLGLVRLVAFLAQDPRLCPAGQPVSLVVDSGTGTTAAGLALGMALLGLPWRVVSVMVAADAAYHRGQAICLAASFLQRFPATVTPDAVAARIHLTERLRPRRFGNVFPGEMAKCSQVAKAHGVLIDPVYTLAAWEVASALAEGSGAPGLSPACSEGRVAMLHTGGALGLQGLAQRYPDSF